MQQDKQTMRAYVADDYGPADALALRVVPRPVLEDGMALVKVSHVALNPLDLKLLRGDLSQMMSLRFPFIPCADLAGEVIASGAGVALAPGTRIVGMSPRFGACAQYCLVPDGARLAVLPPGIDAAAAAALPMVGLTAMAVERAAGVGSGHQVAVIGAAGGVGSILLQLLRGNGAHIVAAGRSGDTEHLLRAGAHAVAVYDERTDAVDALRAQRPAGYDIVIDFAHQGAALERALTLAAPGGCFVSTLFGPAAASVADRVTLMYIRLDPQPGDLQRLLTLCADGLDPNVGAIFTFDQTHRAFAHLAAGQRGKTILNLMETA